MPSRWPECNICATLGQRRWRFAGIHSVWQRRAQPHSQRCSTLAGMSEIRSLLRSLPASHHIEIDTGFRCSTIQAPKARRTVSVLGPVTGRGTGTDKVWLRRDRGESELDTCLTACQLTRAGMPSSSSRREPNTIRSASPSGSSAEKQVHADKAMTVHAGADLAAGGCAALTCGHMAMLAGFARRGARRLLPCLIRAFQHDAAHFHDIVAAAAEVRGTEQRRVMRGMHRVLRRIGQGAIIGPESVRT